MLRVLINEPSAVASTVNSLVPLPVQQPVILLLKLPIRLEQLLDAVRPVVCARPRLARAECVGACAEPHRAKRRTGAHGVVHELEVRGLRCGGEFVVDLLAPRGQVSPSCKNRLGSALR